jgi:hypothetical protein
VAGVTAVKQEWIGHTVHATPLNCSSSAHEAKFVERASCVNLLRVWPWDVPALTMHGYNHPG